MTQRGYLRQPSLRGEGIVFVCDDDIWRVDAGGGTARRLTAGLGEPATPVLSPDGKWIAYVGRDEQHPEVYLMPAEGGPARRMTWLGPDVLVRGWTPDGRILFVTTHGQPFFRNYRAFTLRVDGGIAGNAAAGPGQPPVVRTGQRDGHRPQHGRPRALEALSRRHRRAFVDRRIRQRDVSPDVEARRQHHEPDVDRQARLFPVGFRRRGQSLLVPTRRLRPAPPHGPRHLLRAQCADRRHAHRLSVRRRHLALRPGQQPHGARRRSTCRRIARRRRASSSPRPTISAATTCIPRATAWPSTRAASSSRWRCGRARSASTAWPTASAIATDNGWPTARPSSPSATSRARNGWSSSATVSPRRCRGTSAACRRCAPRPSDSKVALTNHRNEVLLGDLATKKLAVVDRSDTGRSEDLAWSPDGAWLAYSFWTDPRHCAIKLHDVAKRKQHAGHAARIPRLLPGVRSRGQVSVLPVVRTFDPVYDSVQFELSFPRAARPYLIALQSDQRPPFDPEPKGLKPPEDRRKRRQGRRRRRAPVRVDLDGIVRRVAAFPVRRRALRPDRRRRGTRSCGRAFPIPGAHGRGGHKETPGRLELFDFATMRSRNARRESRQLRPRRGRRNARGARGQAPARRSRPPEAARG